MNATRQIHHEEDMALDLGGLLRTISRACFWLLPLTIMISIAVFMTMQLVPPKYMAEARILIESTDNLPGTFRGQAEERAILDSEGVESQVQLLMSADLARRVAKKLDLASVSEFDAGGGVLSGGGSQEERVLMHFYESLKIYRLDGSRVIAVDYSSESPVLAAKVANAVLDEYLEIQSNAKRETTELTSAALQPQIAELRLEVQSARKAVSDFRARADLLVGSDNVPLSQQQLSETNSSYSEAQAARAESQAKADLIRDLLKSGGSLDTASDVLNSTLIQRLRERQIEIQSNIAELSIALLPNHPQLKALQSQLSDYDRQIRAEARKVLKGLENDAKVADQRAKALGNRLEELKKASAKSNADQVRLSELEREANAKATQLDQLLLSFQEADSRLRAQVLPADARIISRASVPIEPYAPKVLASTVIAAIATFVLGCAFVLMREFLNGNALYSLPYEASGAPRQAPVNQAVAQQSMPQHQTPPQYEPYSWNGNYGQMPANFQAAAERHEETPQAQPTKKEKFSVRDVMRRKKKLDPEQEAEEHPELPLEFAMRRTGMKPSRPADMPAEVKNEDVAFEQSTSISQTYEDTSFDLRPEGNEVTVGSAPIETEFNADTIPASDVEAKGRIVVLSVDDHALSHDLAFSLVRRAATSGSPSLLMEVFAEQENRDGAEGFSDIVAGKTPFASVVYRDAGSKAHIIETGRYALTDDMVQSERFKLAIEAIKSTYETVVVDLGAIDGTLASARLLGFADRVLIAAHAPDNDHELVSAANLLAHNTGANVEIVIADSVGVTQRQNGDGYVA